MIIISQNLTNYDFPIPEDAIFRINLAWISDLDTLEEILEKHKEYKTDFYKCSYQGIKSKYFKR